MPPVSLNQLRTLYFRLTLNSLPISDSWAIYPSVKNVMIGNKGVDIHGNMLRYIDS